MCFNAKTTGERKREMYVTFALYFEFRKRKENIKQIYMGIKVAKCGAGCV